MEIENQHIVKSQSQVRNCSLSYSHSSTRKTHLESEMSIEVVCAGCFSDDNLGSMKVLGLAGLCDSLKCFNESMSADAT